MFANQRTYAATSFKSEDIWKITKAGHVRKNVDAGAFFAAIALNVYAAGPGGIDEPLEFVGTQRSPWMANIYVGV